MPASHLSICGRVNAKGENISVAENFKVEKTATGTYKITYYKEGFEYFGAPAVTVEEPALLARVCALEAVTAKGFVVKFVTVTTLLPIDTPFSFTVIGE